MTTLTGQGPAAVRRRAVPWPRLTWVVWRQHRAALTTAAILLAALSLYLLIMGLRIHSAYGAVSSCHPASSARCQNLASAFNINYYENYAVSKIHDIGDPPVISALLLTLPALLGVFAGAPLLSRELATGTFRFAWTQGCGRLRWALAQLALPAITLTAAIGAVGALFSWYLRPFVAEGQVSVVVPIQFPLHGVVNAGWTLAAFAIGAFAGVTIRRTVPALAAALAAWAALALATAIFFRPYYYEAPLRMSGGAPHMYPARLSSSWVLSSWTTGPGGQLVSPATASNLVPLSAQNSPNPSASADWMIRHGFTQWWSYQPPSRYGHFQLIEGGWLLALSAVLIAATVWLIQRRSV
ncbi:MAG: hypothetical protein WBH47_06405 [Streptosporangiaceae bacterium]